MVLMGIDTGGTFTDFVYKDQGSWGVYKLLSTPNDPALAVISGIQHITGDRQARVVHGSTVATNALLERKGAVTALITNRGFEDLLEIGRQQRVALYRLTHQKPDTFIPSDLCFGLPCRIDRNGKIVQPLNKSYLEPLLKSLQKKGVESIAVSFLFSFLNARHEKEVRKALSGLKVPISLSHEILSEFREYERTATTACNAYVQPKMASYLASLAAYKGIHRISIMQSSGGRISAKTAASESVRTILSGPAGGVVGAFEVGKQAGYSKLITFDMGGTSTDVALVDQGLPFTMETTISHLPLKVPAIDIHTVGAGGGSIAKIDVGGSLQVGPESAGADPGPICYGKGDAITVTDANLFLGRLLPRYFLGGHLSLHEKRLAPYFAAYAKRLGISNREVAEGILSVANTTMERAIRMISVERGFDPGEFALVAFGGGGGLHGAALARLLGIPNVLIPKHPGILSAIGMLLADVVKDYSQTVMIPQGIATDQLEEMYRPLKKKGDAALRREGIESQRMLFERYLDMRYVGQSFEIMVPYSTDFLYQFHRLHEKTYGYADRLKPAEIVTLRLRARGETDKPRMPALKRGGKIPPKNARMGRQTVFFDGRKEMATIFRRDNLLAGNRFQGPAIVVEYSSTIVIPPFASAQVDTYGNIIIKIT